MQWQTKQNHLLCFILVVWNWTCNIPRYAYNLIFFNIIIFKWDCLFIPDRELALDERDFSKLYQRLCCSATKNTFNKIGKLIKQYERACILIVSHCSFKYFLAIILISCCDIKIFWGFVCIHAEFFNMRFATLWSLRLCFLLLISQVLELRVVGIEDILGESDQGTLSKSL